MAAPRRSLDQLAADPIFVVGVPRSGTTWVHDILRAHPLVAGVFESMLFEPLNGMGGLLSSAHWGDRRRGVAALVEQDDLVASMRRLAEDVLSRSLQPHHRYLAEKTPSHVMVMPALVQVFPGAKIIHVVRDGRDVVVSTRAARRTWAKAWETPRFGLELASAARRWRRWTVLGQEAAAELGPERVLEVRYEQLRAEPFDGYRQLLTFCGIPFDDELLEEIHQRTDFELSGRSENQTGFYRAGRVGDWRSSFGVVDGVVFNAFAGSRLVELGYERSRLWWPGGGRRSA